MNIDRFENAYFKKPEPKKEVLLQFENGLYLPSKAIIEIKSHRNMSCTEFSLQCLSRVQKQGICAVVDNEFNLSPEYLSKFDINLNELLYVPATEPTELYQILFKLLELKELRLIVINSITNLFSLMFDLKELTANLIQLKEYVQKSNATVIVLNPYYDLSYNIFNEIIKCCYLTKFAQFNKLSILFNNNEYQLMNNHI